MILIQLSDLHITERTEITAIKRKIDRLIESVESDISVEDVIVICVCGDVITLANK
jgi:hypothetical protein